MIADRHLEIVGTIIRVVHAELEAPQCASHRDQSTVFGKRWFRLPKLGRFGDW